jgi:acyl-CoA synthetase (AMP-forming)/AMP-acid ligase II
MSPHAFTVYDMIAGGAAVHGEAPALIHGERADTFRDLLRRVDGLAGGLARLGLARGDRVCILAQNDPAYLELYGACARQGLVVYPINWRLSAEEVERVVERAGPRLFVADAGALAVVGGWPQTRRSVEHWYQLGEPAAPGFTALATLYRDGAVPPRPEVAADELFAVISTAAHRVGRYAKRVVHPGVQQRGQQAQPAGHGQEVGVAPVTAPGAK